MRIMLINHYAGSPTMGMEYRPYYLSQEWIKLGHEVVIIAASNSHVRAHQPDITKDFTSENIDGIEYLWIKTPPYEGNGFGRVLNMRSFTKALRNKSKYLASHYKPDLVIASSTYPLDNYYANRIAKLAGAKYFYEVHDLWPLSPKELGGMSSFHPFIIWMQRAENYAYKHADQVISMLPVTKGHMKEHGLDLKKWKYIPNGINVSEWEKQEAVNAIALNKIEEIKAKFKKTIGYTGSFGIANSLEILLNAAPELSKLDIAVVLVGGGSEKQNLIHLTEKLGVNNVFFIDTIPKKEVPALLNLFDILFIGWRRKKLYRFGISPNKVFDYMMASKPIIQAIEAGNDMIAEASCGFSIEPENPEAIIEATKKILSLSPQEIELMGKNGRKFVLENHNYEILAKRFLEDV